MYSKTQQKKSDNMIRCLTGLKYKNIITHHLFSVVCVRLVQVIIPDRKWCGEMEEGQQQEHLSHTDGRHHEDEEGEDSDFLRRQNDFFEKRKRRLMNLF